MRLAWRSGGDEVTAPTLPPRLPAAVDGTDPRGILAFSAPLPDALQKAEDSTQAADFDRYRTGLSHYYRDFKPDRDTVAARDDAQAAGAQRIHWTSWYSYLRDATDTERALLAHLGYDVPAASALFYTRVTFFTTGVRNRTWPALNI